MSLPVSLGGVPPGDLVHERLQLHAAAQTVAWVGRRLLPPADGPIRAALFWDGRHGGMLAGAPIGRSTAGSDLRVGLGFDPAGILLLDGNGRTIREHLALDGTTVPAAWTWLTAALGRAGLDASGLPPPPDDRLPTDHLRTGGPFRIDRTRAAELGRWFDTAAELLTEQAASKGLDPAAPCWSHHFDMALVVPLARPDGGRASTDDNGTDTRPQPQVTLGFSPGDETIPEPYLYVLAWPLPASLGALPKPPRPGRWQRDGWTGLALAGSVLLAPTGEDPIPVARSFLERGFEVAWSVALAA